MQHLNIEIKAKCKNKEFVKKILQEKDAKYIGLDHQIDTYFKIDKGRLKLREGDIENYLIYMPYDQEEQEVQNWSEFA